MLIQKRFKGFYLLAVLMAIWLVAGCAAGGPVRSLRVESSRGGSPGNFEASNIPNDDINNPFDDVEVELDWVTWHFPPLGRSGSRDEGGFQFKLNWFRVSGEENLTKVDGFGFGIGGEIRGGFISFGEMKTKFVAGVDAGLMDLSLSRDTLSGTGAVQHIGPNFRTDTATGIGSYYIALGISGENLEAFIFRRDFQFLSGPNELKEIKLSFTGLAIGFRFD